MKERIQKVLARQGVASRREIERWIVEGRIKVNGKPAEIGQMIDSRDRVVVDRATISVASERQIPTLGLMYHKPEGLICTRKDPEGRETVFEQLPPVDVGRWVAVGRLDVNTSGLLLFTTDGALANGLMHPRSEIIRVYVCRIFGELSEEQHQQLLQGVVIDGERMAFESIQAMQGEGTNRWYRVTLREGKNREVRRLWESQSLRVSRLMRVQYGPIELPRNLKPGETRLLTDGQLQLLKSVVVS